MSEHIEYYRVRKEHQAYLGVRHFKFNYMADHTIQACYHCGDIKKGKSNTFGVYLINKLTFLTNYLSPNYVEPCKKNEYEKYFDKTLKMLK